MKKTTMPKSSIACSIERLKYADGFVGYNYDTVDDEGSSSTGIYNHPLKPMICFLADEGYLTHREIDAFVSRINNEDSKMVADNIMNHIKSALSMAKYLKDNFYKSPKGTKVVCVLPSEKT